MLPRISVRRLLHRSFVLAGFSVLFAVSGFIIVSVVCGEFRLDQALGLSGILVVSVWVLLLFIGLLYNINPKMWYRIHNAKVEHEHSVRVFIPNIFYATLCIFGIPDDVKTTKKK